MNREGAETYLRLLAEAMMRGSLPPAQGPPWAHGPGGGRARVTAAGLALTAVGAVDVETAEDILADFDLAVNLRQLHGPASRSAAGTMPPGTTVPGTAVPRTAASGSVPGTVPPGVAPPGTLPVGTVPPGIGGPPGIGPPGIGLPGIALPGVMPPGIGPAGTMSAAAMARWTARIKSGRSLGPLTRAGRLAGSGPAESHGSPEQDPDPAPAGPAAADRFLPVGLRVPFHDEGISGDMYLLSFAQTGAGARFIAAWENRVLPSQYPMGLQYSDLIPLELFTVTDDRGARYNLILTPGSGPEWINEIGLRPVPPDSVRWLDVAAPGGPAVRVDLERENQDAEPEVTEASLSAGEHLLIMLADRLLTVAPEAGRDWRRQMPVMSPGLLQAMTAGLGDIVAALEAADVLSPLSPLPARLAALCASLGIGGHGITVAPAHDLPERWLSLLAHYQRRKPEMTQARDGYAAVAAALPELDGIRLALLGLDNTEGGSSLHVLATGLEAAGHPGPLGIDLDFPLSLWLRDSGGRWHASRAAGWHRVGGERALRLKLVPPLPRSTAWIEVLAGGRSAEVRARVPLRWGDPT
jgi:hypothetical protein